MKSPLAAALILLAFPVAAQGALADELAGTLDAMSAAAVAGDSDAYLEHIATDEPEFLVEQVAWARGITRITPDMLTYTFLTEPAIGDDGEATAEVRITWNTPNWEGDDRELDLPVRFVMEDGNWHFGGRDWEELDSDGVRVLYVDGNSGMARDTIAMWPDIKEHVEAGFELELDHPQVVKLYGSMQELMFSIYPSYVEQLGGWNEPGESIKVLSRGVNRQWLQAVLAHEYGHALTFAMGGADIPLAVERAHSMPWWVLEGSAELGANKFHRAYDRAQRLVPEWHANDSLADWGDLTNFYETDPADYGYVYVQGLHFVAYVSDRFGRTARNAWLRGMMSGETLEDATTAAFGVTFTELDADWRRSITPDL